MPGTRDFAQDLKAAQELERRLAEVIKERETVESVEFNDDYRFDLMVRTKTGRDYTIELKHDMTTARTGNVGIEFRSRGKWSGIETTEANYWVFAIENEFFIIPTQKLKALIDEVSFSAVGRGGDPGSFTAMYLFPKELLAQHWKRLGFVSTGIEWDEIGSGRK